MPTAKELEQWATQMGWFPSKAYTDDVIFARATATPDRRRLWQLIAEKVVDRRILLKIRKQPQDEGNAANIIQAKEKEIESEEKHIDQLLRSYKDRVNRANSAKERTKSLGIKSIMSRMRKQSNLDLINWCTAYQDDFLRSTQLPLPALDHSNWLDTNMMIVGKNWRLFTLRDDVLNQINKYEMYGNELWHVLNNKLQLFIEKTSDHNAEAEKHYQQIIPTLESSYPTWESIMDQQKQNSETAETLLLLTRGLMLRRLANNPYPEDQWILETARKFLTNFPSNDETIEDKNLAEQAETHVVMQRDSDLAAEKNGADSRHLLRVCYQTLIHMKADLDGLDALNVQSTKNLVENMAELRALVNETEKKLFEESCAINTPKQICKTTSNFSNLKVEERDACPCDKWMNMQDIFLMTSLGDVLNALEKYEEKNLQGVRGTRLMKTVITTSRRTVMLKEKLETNRRIFKLSIEQPFGDMIPDSYTVNGLTFKEWRMQSMLTDLHVQDQSTDITFNLTK